MAHASTKHIPSGITRAPVVSNKHIKAATARIQSQASSAIKAVLVNAKAQKLPDLVEACEAELRLRGSLDLTSQQAVLAAAASERIAGKPLTEVIQIAFTEIPAREEECQILRAIGDQPGISFAELNKIYRNGDLGLVIGHLTYYRFGYFRPFLTGATQSDLLLDRDKSAKSIRYTLRPEAAAAFASLGLSGTAGAVPPP